MEGQLAGHSPLRRQQPVALQPRFYWAAFERLIYQSRKRMRRYGAHAPVSDALPAAVPEREESLSTVDGGAELADDDDPTELELNVK